MVSMQLEQYNLEDNVRYETYDLDRLRMRLSVAIPAECREGLDIKLSEKYADRLVLLLRQEFYGEKRQEEVPVEFVIPKNWFQHLKKAVLPPFLLKFWPVKTVTLIKTVKLDRSWVMPNVPLTSPETRTFWVRDNHKIGSAT